MKCVIAGGAGFIGKHLAHALAELGHEVVVFDLLASNYSSLCHPNIRYRHQDITQPALHDFRCDWLFHLAARADVIPSIEHPWTYHRVNVDGTVNVLDHAVRLGVKKFIYASSTSIYGIPQEYPTPETAPADPQYPYALTKWVAEQYVMHWGRVYRMPVVSLRITTAYGPRMNSRGAYGSVFKVFLAQKANGAPFTVVGNGSQSRDFVYINDVVDAFIKAAESPLANGEIFNVGFGQPRTVNEVVDLLGADSVVHIPRRPGEPNMTWADISKIRQYLQWRPAVSLEQGVKIMLEHLHEWKNERAWTREDIEQETRKWFKCLS